MSNKRILTTITKGYNGFNISYDNEKKFGKDLLKILPIGWKVSFNWLQFAFYDIQYILDKDRKMILISYHRNLLKWKNEIINEIKLKINELKIKELNERINNKKYMELKLK